MTDRIDRIVALLHERYGFDVDIDALRAKIQAAEEEVITREVIGQLPPRLVHEMRNNWAYFEAQITEAIDPASLRHDELSTIHWYGRAERATVDSPEPVMNPAEYRGTDPIEDVALAPNVDWSDADKKVALEEAIRIFGLEPGQWFDIEWPPTGHLSDPGMVYHTDFVPCEAHTDQESEGECPGCEASVREEVEQMAQWKWTTTLTIYEMCFDRDGFECSTEVHTERGFEVATTEQDPRHLLIGPPGRDIIW